MNTPKKVTEKISLPLMFVTFVMAVLMFAVSPVSAAPPPAECDINFCDQDDDGFFRVHKKCACVGEIDCDDSVTDPTNTCDADPIDGGEVFTLTLTDGPFQFGPIEVFVNSKGNLNSTGEVLNMTRPTDNTPSTGNVLTPQEAWDAVFLLCARPISASADTDSISVTPNNWGFGKNSDTNIHIDLQEIFLEETTADGSVVRKEIQIHLRGVPGDSFLPVSTTSPEVFILDYYTIWGKPWSGSGRSWDTCHSSSDDLLLFPESTLTISIPPAN